MRKRPDQRPRVAFVADVHVANHRDWGGRTREDGLNDRGALTISTLAQAHKTARQDQGAGRLIVCGDLFHHRRPEPALVAAVQRVLEDEDVVFPGNHDLITASAAGGNTAVEPLHPSVSVCNVPSIVEGLGLPPVFCVPFDARARMEDVIEEACAANKDKIAGCALATHVGIVDEHSPPWLRDAPDALYGGKLTLLMKKYGMPVAFVGNYHQHREWTSMSGELKIVQLGALNPTGFGDEGCTPGMYGGLALWDGKDVEWMEIAGPRFVKVPRGQDPPDIFGNMTLHVRAEKPARQHGGDSEAYYFGRYEEVDAIEPNVLEAQDLAKPDKLLESAEQALEEYVSKMVLAEGVDRALVMAEVKKFWRQG